MDKAVDNWQHRNIRRLSVALHIAVLVTFLKNLPPSETLQLREDLLTAQMDQLYERWDTKLKAFITQWTESNATFCMHVEMMIHCDEKVAISVAERLGAPSGHNLLLAAVKKSLLFSFLNGASKYAAFCTRLIYEHYKASHFHRCLKQTLFSIHHSNSSVNFGLDTTREIDHRAAKKCIRPG